MPKFSIKDLLKATTLISVGAAMLAYFFHHREQSDALGLLSWFVPTAIIGAGIFTPFGRPWWFGAAVITAIQVSVMAAMMLLARH